MHKTVYACVCIGCFIQVSSEKCCVCVCLCVVLSAAAAAAAATAAAAAAAVVDILRCEYE